MIDAELRVRLTKSFRRHLGMPNHEGLTFEEIKPKRVRVTDPARGAWAEFDTSAWRIRMLERFSIDPRRGRRRP